MSDTLLQLLLIVVTIEGRRRPVPVQDLSFGYKDGTLSFIMYYVIYAQLFLRVAVVQEVVAAAIAKMPCLVLSFLSKRRLASFSLILEKKTCILARGMVRDAVYSLIFIYYF